MTDDPMYLTKNAHGVYYYRRPIVEADQSFWRGPSGTPRKEWNRSLRTKDRREAISLMADAADAYEEERASQFQQHGHGASLEAAESGEPSAREREEQAAADRQEAARRARYEARAEHRIAVRQRMLLSTAELSPEEAAWRDIARENEQDAAAIREATAMQVAANATLAVETGKAPSGRTVAELIAAYEADKSPGWSGSSKKAVVPVFRVLRDVFPSRTLASITREDARGVVKLLAALPTQIGKRKELQGLTIPEAVEKGRKLGLPTIQPKTVNDGYLLHIASMWNWAVKEMWITASPFTGLAIHDPVADEDRRDPFTVEQLNTLFRSEGWRAPWSADTGQKGAYWVPLLCLFHGLRLAEAAGLRVENIGDDDGVSVIRVRPYGGIRLKNKDARGAPYRCTPI